MIFRIQPSQKARYSVIQNYSLIKDPTQQERVHKISQKILTEFGKLPLFPKRFDNEYYDK